jgi:hypothetical protein
MKFRGMPRVAAWSAILFATVGAVILAVSGWVIAAWHLLVLATPSLGVPHLQYDTAWAFAFCGATLIAYALRLRRIGRLFACVPPPLAAIRMIAYPLCNDRHPSDSGTRMAALRAGNYNDMGVLRRWCSSFLARHWCCFSRRQKTHGARFWWRSSRRPHWHLHC